MVEQILLLRERFGRYTEHSEEREARRVMFKFVVSCHKI